MSIYILSISRLNLIHIQPLLYTPSASSRCITSQAGSIRQHRLIYRLKQLCQYILELIRIPICPGRGRNLPMHEKEIVLWKIFLKRFTVLIFTSPKLLSVIPDNHVRRKTIPFRKEVICVWRICSATSVHLLSITAVAFIALIFTRRKWLIVRLTNTFLFFNQLRYHSFFWMVPLFILNSHKKNVRINIIVSSYF